MRLTLLLPALVATVVGCAEPGVIRVVDGRRVEGRFISGAAYALFARGAAAEAEGELSRALRNFELAASEDPGSPEIWTRLGTLRCRMASAGSPPAPAQGDFAYAISLDTEHAAAFRERARCVLARGNAAAALPDAERALALDPDDLDTALVRADALDRAGRTEEARRALRSLAARRPTATEPWTRLAAIAQRIGDTALAQEAGERLRVSSPLGLAHPAPPEGAAPLALLDRAILAGDLPAAQRLALRQRLPGAQIALRAVALGKSTLAREQAETLLGADPEDTSARIALVAAADLRGDLPAMADLMRSLPRRIQGPSSLARWLLADALRRRVSAEAALAWLAAGESLVLPETAPSDPLLTATEKRVRAALSAH